MNKRQKMIVFAAAAYMAISMMILIVNSRKRKRKERLSITYGLSTRWTSTTRRFGLLGPMAPETQPHMQPPPSWSALPMDLAVLVLRLLPVYADRAHFAAVCPQWRAAARLPLSSPQPLLALPDGTFYSLPSRKQYRFPGCGSLVTRVHVAAGSSSFTTTGVSWTKPFSRASVTLPALSCVCFRPPNAVAKWSESDDGRAKFVDLYCTWMHINNSKKLHISKLIMCSSNLVAALVGVGHTSQILMCQPGALSWSVRAYDECKGFEDMSFYQGKLYTIATDENLLVVNISEHHSTGNPQVSKTGQVIKGDTCPWYSAVFEDNSMARKKIYLVECRGALLMVRRTIWCQVPEPGVDGEIVARNHEFEVFQADFEHSRWVKVTTIRDDHMLFLGRRCSRAVPVSPDDFPGDNILFLDDEEENRLEYAYEDKNASFTAYHLRSLCQFFLSKRLLETW